MPKQNVYVQSFAVGVVDRKKLVRTDLERMRLAAELQTNLMCTTSGNMFLRPGLEMIAETQDSDRDRLQDFVFTADDAALLEFCYGSMRVLVDDVLVTRPAVSTTVNNGDFAAVGTWDLVATDGASSTITFGSLRLRATARGSVATATQHVFVNGNNQNKEHALAITVNDGPVTFRLGTTAGDDNLISEAQLERGFHSLAFTPTGPNVYIFFQQADYRTQKTVSHCQIEPAGVMQVPTPFGVGPLTKLRFSQSADVIFLAWGKQQYRVERRGERSWSVVRYKSDYGPFTDGRTAPVRLRPTDTEGETTLIASDKFFTQAHVGSLFRLFHDGQRVVQSLAGDQIYTDPIKVTGIFGEDGPSDRDWTYSVSGTWTGTMYVQRSYDNENYGFKNYRNFSDTNVVGFTINVTDQEQTDHDDNIIIYYRVGFANGYTDGAATVSINYDGGGGYGICRVTGFNSKTSVNVDVIKPFKNTTYTEDWREGLWSDAQTYPTAVCLSEGRLFWAGNDKFWGSEPDAYNSFDEEIEGDSRPINRSIAIGNVNQVQWLLPLQRVQIGANGAEISVKSSGLDEPLTSTALTLKSSSTVGSAAIPAVKIDGRGIFTDRTSKALFQLEYDGGTGDYMSTELTRLCSSWFKSGIVDSAVSRRPDTRVWCVLADGSCMCMVYEPEQQIIAFIPITTNGSFERVAVLPGTDQDNVYFTVKRTIEGVDRRFIEKMALDSEAAPDTISKVMDSHVSGTNSPASATITGLGHLVGQMVKVWADGAPLTEVVDDLTVPKLFLVSGSGTITLPAPVTNYCAGLPYSGVYKSSRLAYAAAQGTAMLSKQKVSTIGLIMSDWVRSGVRYGQYLDNEWHPLMPLPIIANGDVADEVTEGDIVTDEGSITFDGAWGLDSRVCLTVDWPANFLGLVIDITTNA